MRSSRDQIAVPYAIRKGPARQAGPTIGRIAGCVLLATGCQKPIEPIFAEVRPPIVWPPPPDTPRISYVGQLLGEQSLHRPPDNWSGLRRIFAGPEPTTGFSTPVSIAVRGDRVYVADSQARSVYRLDLAGRSFLPIREAGGRPLAWPIDVAWMGDELVVADSGRAEALVFSGAGQFRRSLGGGVLQRPTAVASDDALGRVWVLDAAAHGILCFDATGAEQFRRTTRGTGPGEFNFPAGFAYKPEVGLVVADSMNFRVQILDASGAPIRAFGRKGDAAGDFSLPRDVAIDSENHIYVVDSQFENVQVFDTEGRLLMAFGREGHGPGEFYLPSGITIDERDRIWVADAYNRRVQVFQYIGATP